MCTVIIPTPRFSLVLLLQSVIGGSEEVTQEKKALEAFKGDPFMEMKYTMMKKLEQTSDVSVRQASTFLNCSCLPGIALLESVFIAHANACSLRMLFSQAMQEVKKMNAAAGK